MAKMADLRPRSQRSLTANHRYALIIDPIDGTEDFVRGARTMRHGGHPRPVDGAHGGKPHLFSDGVRLYFAVRGMGAFLADGLWGAPRHWHVEPPRSWACEAA